MDEFFQEFNANACACYATVRLVQSNALDLSRVFNVFCKQNATDAFDRLCQIIKKQSHMNLFL